VGARWLIYGANGYTGELIARAAAGRSPILAGRCAQRVEPLARELGLDWRAFALDSPGQLDNALTDVDLVLHCAGPFAVTSAPMLAACLRTSTHYLDITGEIDVFEHAFTLHEAARQAGIVVCPGVGFDVIPTDCVAVALHAALPDADRLALGFDSRGQVSRGTLRTAAAGAAQGVRVRRAGQIVTVPTGSLTRSIDFGAGEKPATAISWGDVATAYRSTGIPNIEVYVPTSARRTRRLRLIRALRWLLRRRVIRRRIDRHPRGPSAQSRAQTPAYVWGEVTNPAGQRRVARIRTANGYDLTVFGAIAAVDHLLSTRPAAGESRLPGGVYTPTQLLGPGVVAGLPGSGPLTLDHLT
jgi:short subunit dehydrogenase-like uncharacterized protein